MTKLIQLLKPHLQQIKKSKRGRKAKAKPVKVNRRTELYYTRQLLEISKYCQEQSAEIILPEVGRNIGDGWLTDMLSKFRSKVENYIIAVAMPLATKVVVDVQQEVDKQVAEHTKASIGVDLTPLYQASDIQNVVDNNIQANASLIKSIPKQYADKVEALVQHALQTGQTNEELAQEIKKLGYSTDARARLIARDQMGKINSNINKQRQMSLGVESYTWLTTKDDRVRKDHQHKQGKTFKWTEPPSGGHPGEPIGCRCTAVPNYDDILVDDEAIQEIDEQAQNAQQHSQTSAQLLNSKLNSQGVKLDEILTVEKNIGQGNKALRASVQWYEELKGKFAEVPAIWAVNHYSIHSKYINDLLRGKNVADEFADISKNAIKLLDDLFARDQAVIQKPFTVSRGYSFTTDQIELITSKLSKNENVHIPDTGYFSTTLTESLAENFSKRSATKGRQPVIFRLKLNQGVRAIEISSYHFYTGDNEILLDRSSNMRINSMIQREDGIYEVEAEILAHEDQQKIGDESKKEKVIIHCDGGRDEDPYWDRWCTDLTIVIG